MPTVRVKENEPIEIALRRFKRACEKAGILTEVRKRVAYEKPTTERKRKEAAAVKRYRKTLERQVLVTAKGKRGQKPKKTTVNPREKRRESY